MVVSQLVVACTKYKLAIDYDLIIAFSERRIRSYVQRCKPTLCTEDLAPDRDDTPSA